MKRFLDHIVHGSFSMRHDLIADKFRWSNSRVDVAHFFRTDGLSIGTCRKTPDDSSLEVLLPFNFTGSLKKTGTNNMSILLTAEKLTC